MNSHSIDNFFTIQKLLGETTWLLKSLFRKKYEQIKNQVWNDDKQSGKYFQTSEGRHIYNSTKSQSQKRYLAEGDSKIWDLALFEVIFSKQPFKDDSLKHIKSICEISNEMSHIKTFSLSNEYFEKLWSKLSNEMIHLGYSKHKLNELKNKKSILKHDSNKELLKLKELAKVKINKEDYDEAIKLYTSALLLDDISNEESSILYCNRSFAYYKLHKNSANSLDDRYLLKALADALNALHLNPNWYKPYARLGIIYQSLNDLENSADNFELSLALSPDNQEVINLLSEVKFKLFEQTRRAHLDKMSSPYTIEELDKMNYELYGKQVGYDEQDWSERLKFTEQWIREGKSGLDDSILDVLKGHKYFYGSNTVNVDYTEAAKYYGKAAMKGNPDGIYNLAKMHQNGLGVKKDFKLAFELFKEASEKEPFIESLIKIPKELVRNMGVAEADHSLGIWYQEGIYVEQDYEMAALYYKRAIEHGDPRSGNNLAALYVHGKGVEKDFNKAEAYYLWAYRNGENLAITNIMDLYLQKNDSKKALLWHERGLEKNDIFHKLNDKDIRRAIELAENTCFYTGLEDLFRQLHLNINLRSNETPIENKNFFLEDPFRNYLIKTHRSNIHEKTKNFSSFEFTAKRTFKPPRKQSNLNLDTNHLKEIYLNEIDFTKDHVLEGFFLNSIVIDLPDYLGMMSVIFIIEDTNRNVERMAVYNLGNDYDQISKDYRIGTKITIRNPYIRMARDGKPMIRIDDPTSIVIQAKRVEKMCSYCGKENSKYLCSKCEKASYCCKECQVNDFKILNHKLICFC